MDEITRREFEEIERRLTEAGIPFVSTIGKLSGRPYYDIADEHLEAAQRIFYAVQVSGVGEPPEPPSGGQAFA
jgi:hypothetical protein